MGIGHRCVSAAGTLAIAAALNRTGLATVSPESAVLAAALAVPFSAGRWTSPDADLERGWAGRMGFGHRWALHRWGWPLLVIAVIWYLTDGQADFAVYGPALGWLLHIWPADWLFGKGYNLKKIPRGIPAGPFWGRRRAGGFCSVTNSGEGHHPLELAATGVAALALAYQLWALGATMVA